MRDANAFWMHLRPAYSIHRNYPGKGNRSWIVDRGSLPASRQGSAILNESRRGVGT